MSLQGNAAARFRPWPCSAGRRARRAAPGCGPGGDHDPRLRWPAAPPTTVFPALHQPVRGERLHDVNSGPYFASSKPYTPPKREKRTTIPPERRGQRVDGHEVPEDEPDDDEGDKADQDQAGHLQPLAGGKAHPQRRARQVEQHQRGQRQQVGADHLGRHVGTWPQRRDPQLAGPAPRYVARDPRSGPTTANIAP